MSVSTLSRDEGLSLSNSVIAGAIAGLGGGLVFGLLMGIMGILPMVGMLAGQKNSLVGLVVHMIISAFIGGTYGVVASRLPYGWSTIAIAGVANGVVWWVLGALILMPLMLGMTQMVLVIGSTQWMSLMGHLVYGVITALLFVPLSRRL